MVNGQTYIYLYLYADIRLLFQEWGRVPNVKLGIITLRISWFRYHLFILWEFIYLSLFLWCLVILYSHCFLAIKKNPTSSVLDSLHSSQNNNLSNHYEVFIGVSFALAICSYSLFVDIWRTTRPSGFRGKYQKCESLKSKADRNCFFRWDK